MNSKHNISQNNITVLHGQTAILLQDVTAWSISDCTKKSIVYTSYTLLAAYPQLEVLIDSCGFFNLNSEFNFVHNPAVSHTNAETIHVMDGAHPCD